MSQSPIRVVIIIIMDHSYNNNNKWRLHAIFSDPRVWIKGGSTMDQHGSTWIKRLQHAPFSLSLQHVAAVLTHGSCVRRPTLQASGSCVRLMAHASGVRRQTPRAPFSRPIQPIQPPPLSVMTTTKRRHFPMLLLLDLRPLRCMAWGNTTLLPHAIQRNGHE